MKQRDFDKLYDKYSSSFTKVYRKGKAAVIDGFDFSDIKTFSELAEEVLVTLDSFQDGLNLDEKKDFLVYFAMKLYYQQKLPWWARFIPKYFIKKNLRKYIGKVLDYLNDKGIIAAEESE